MTIKKVTKYMVFGLLVAVLPAFASADLNVPNIPMSSTLDSISGTNIPIVHAPSTLGSNVQGNSVVTANNNPVVNHPNNYPNIPLSGSQNQNNGGNGNYNWNDSASADVEIDTITSIETDSAKVKVSFEVDGYTVNSSNEVRVWVKYGTSSSNLNKTSDYEYSSDESDTVSITLEDLNDDTKYYVQPYIRVDGETYDGSKESFTTDEEGSSYTTTSSSNGVSYSQALGGGTTYTYSNTGVQASSGVIVTNTSGSDVARLVVKNNQTTIGKGSITYMVEYKNISKYSMSRARLVVTLPSNMRVNATTAYGMNAGNTYVMDLGTLSAGEEGSVVFTGTLTKAAGFTTAHATLTGTVNGKNVTIDSADADTAYGVNGSMLTGSALNSGAGTSLIVIIVILAIAGIIIAATHFLVKDRPIVEKRMYHPY